MQSDYEDQLLFTWDYGTELAQVARTELGKIWTKNGVLGNWSAPGPPLQERDSEKNSGHPAPNLTERKLLKAKSMAEATTEDLASRPNLTQRKLLKAKAWRKPPPRTLCCSEDTMLFLGVKKKEKKSVATLS